MLHFRKDIPYKFFLKVVVPAYNFLIIFIGMEMNVEKNKSNENFKTTIPSNNYDRPKITGECEMF